MYARTCCIGFALTILRFIKFYSKTLPCVLKLKTRLLIITLYTRSQQCRRLFRERELPYERSIIYRAAMLDLRWAGIGQGTRKDGAYMSPAVQAYFSPEEGWGEKEIATKGAGDRGRGEGRGGKRKYAYINRKISPGPQP